MNSKVVLSVVIVVIMLLSALSTAIVMAGNEQVEGTSIDASPFSIMPESRSVVGAEMPLNEPNNDDTLCEDVDIIFIMDCSGSMLTEDADGGITRLQAAKTAAKGFIDLLPTGTNTRVGVVSFESYGYAEIERTLTTNFAAAKTAIDDLSISGWGAMTSIGEGFKKGREEFVAHGGTNKRIFLLLTDGIANSYPTGWSPPAGWVSPPVVWDPDPNKETAEKYAFVEAHSAMTLDVENPTKVYTVGMGAQVNEDFLEVLAHSSGGEYFFAGTTQVSEMFAEVRADICLGDITVLILSNFWRMSDLGYFSLLDSDPIVGQLTGALTDLRDNNPNGRGVIVDLGYLGNDSIDTAYDNWDGHEDEVTATNSLVSAIDDYIEDLKQDDYPLLRYVIIVGSHEVIPMKARPDDHQWWIDPAGPAPGYWLDERHWADGLPQTSDYLYDIYHSGTHGHYLTDTPYSDLSYRDTSTDHELTPEISVARLVETPQQIIDVIDAYMDNDGEIPKDHFVSMASADYLDGGTLASDYMDATGVPTDDSLVQCNYNSASVPPLLNAQHDVVYFAGHGEYNVISTGGGDAFMAGNHATRGDTNAINPIDGAVIITSGCHNGVNFGNMLYHAPDAGTTYHEFPEDFAERGVVAYIGATGYTAISVVHDGAGNRLPCNADASFTGWNERLSTNVVYYVVNGVDIGRAFRNGAKDYFRAASPLGSSDRRVLAIPTLYGIPTYKDPATEQQSSTKTAKSGFGIQKFTSVKPGQISQEITVIVSDYTVESSGIVTIPGVEQVVSFNEPILPELFVERVLPFTAELASVEWDEGASESVVVTNHVPIAGMACREASFPGEFDHDGFWPTIPYKGYRFLSFGAGGHEVGLGINPVQYNSRTGETRIWTKMVFDVKYGIPDTGISIVSLATDKNQYPSNDNVELSMELSNSGYTRLVDLDVIMRDLDTSDEIITLDVGLMGLEGGTTTDGSYSVNLGDVPSYQIEGKTIEAELIASDPHDGDILASRSVTFEVVSGVTPELAYIYSTDTSTANSYKSFLDSNGYSTTLIPIGNVAATDFSRYSAIIIGSDTESSGSWDDPARVSGIDSSCRPIIGLGEGGYDFFGQLSLSTGYPNGWHGNENSIYVVDPAHPVFNTPNTITMPPDKVIQLYGATNHVGIDLPEVPADVVVLGREVTDVDHYALSLEKNKYLLWGFTASPDNMTKVGEDLFLNVVNYQVSPISYILDQAQEGTNYGFWFEKTVIRWQEFKPTQSSLSQIDLYIHKSGNPGNLCVSVEDQGGEVLWENTVDGGDIGTAGWIEVPVAPSISLQPDNSYYIYVWSDADSPDTEQRYFWRGQTESDYDRGISSVENSWPGYDFAFRTWSMVSPPCVEGKNIIYHADLGAGIWRMNSDGSGKNQLTDHGWFAEYSPDNTKIAFGEFYQNGIWVMNADGTGQKELTESGNAPTWSPDSTKIAYHDGDTGGMNRRIWVMNADGSGAKKLSDNPGSFPKWSPDGKTIAYHGEVNNGVWLINPDGTGETCLHEAVGYPSWSPDGTQITYVSDDWCIWIMNSDGTDKTKLTDRDGIHPDWCPNGTQIAYERSTEKKGIRVINVDGTNDHVINEEGHAPDWLNAIAPPNIPPNVPSNPSPANHATSVSINTDLSWTGGDPDAGDTVTYDVYFGTSASPPLVSNDQLATTYDPGTLNPNTQYYWQIIATDNHAASTTGPVWDFTTGQPGPTITWNCPLGGEPLIAPNPGKARPNLSVPAACDGITASAGAQLWGIYYLVEIGPQAGTWMWYIPGFATSTLTQLELGELYYVVVSGPCTLTIPQ